MAFIDRLSDAEIRRNYTHYGVFCGIVPVYLADLDSDAPNVVARNWCPEWLVSVAAWLYCAFLAMAAVAVPFWEPEGFPIKITGKIDRYRRDRRH